MGQDRQDDKKVFCVNKFIDMCESKHALEMHHEETAKHLAPLSIVLERSF